MIIFSAEITITGVITFLGTAVNKGVINGTAVFKGNSKNGTDDNDEAEEPPVDGTVNGSASFMNNSGNASGGLVTGSGTFTGCSTNKGIVDGAESVSRDAGCPPFGNYVDYDPPLVCGWQIREYGTKKWRRLSCLGSLNAPTILSTKIAGPWQEVPKFQPAASNPETYRPLARLHYVLDARRVTNIGTGESYNLNYPDGYCIPEGYSRPAVCTYWFDCDGEATRDESCE